MSPSRPILRRYPPCPASSPTCSAAAASTTWDEARDFLNVSDSLFKDPDTLPDIERAAERLASARRDGETVAVYGDFDADGVTGTALVKALRRYGLRTLHYIPHRVSGAMA